MYVPSRHNGCVERPVLGCAVLAALPVALVVAYLGVWWSSSVFFDDSICPATKRYQCTLDEYVSPVFGVAALVVIAAWGVLAAVAIRSGRTDVADPTEIS